MASHIWRTALVLKLVFEGTKEEHSRKPASPDFWKTMSSFIQVLGEVSFVFSIDLMRFLKSHQ